MVTSDTATGGCLLQRADARRIDLWSGRIGQKNEGIAQLMVMVMAKREHVA
jgi:hypothetical protein